MTLTYGFKSIRDLAAKLHREGTALQEKGVTADAFFNFVLTGYSMIDWVRNDPSLPSSALKNNAVSSLYSDHWLKICGDLATAIKHFKVTSRTPVVANTAAEQGFGVGRFGIGPFGVGEHHIVIELDDGENINAPEFVTGVIKTWTDFFQKHGI